MPHKKENQQFFRNSYKVIVNHNSYDEGCHVDVFDENELELYKEKLPEDSPLIFLSKYFRGEIKLENTKWIDIECGNITLNDSVANYDYLEIYFRTNDSINYKNSVKIYSPDNALVPLSYPLVATNGTAIYWKTKTVRVSGNSIFSSDGSRYAEATIKATTSISQKNYVYITRVVGYR